MKEMNHRPINTCLLVLLFASSFSLAACDFIGDQAEGESETDGVSLFPVRIDGDWGYINENGRIRIEPNFNAASSFSEGLARVREGNIGYIDPDGEYVIRPRFVNGRPFAEGLAAVELDGRWGYINKSGAFAINPQFDQAFNFTEGRAFVQTSGGKWEYIDLSGQVVRSAQTPDLLAFNEEENGDDDNQFSSGLALVYDLDLQQYGYIDNTGDMAISFQYAEARSFNEGLAAIKISDSWGFIDTKGNTAISPRYIEAGDFGDGLVPVRENSNEWGYADKGGRMVIPPQYEEARAFSEGRAAVLVDGFWGFIDRSGELLDRPDYDEVSPFEKGAAQVIVEKLDPDNENNRLTTWGYVGRDGKLIWYPTR